MQKTELVWYIQGNFGYGWEDMSGYPMGERQKDYGEQSQLCRNDLKEYRLSGCGTYRIIERREPLEED